MTAWRADFAWQEQFVPIVKSIVGPLLLTPSPLEMDTGEATDFLVLTARDMRIGCRIRRPGYATRYPRQFTLRSHRASGTKTELSKIVDGWGDWLFYGHASEDGTLGIWHVIDLHAFRAHLIRNRHVIRKGQTSNGDGTAFTWFDIDSFPPNPDLIVSETTIASVAA